MELQFKNKLNFVFSRSWIKIDIFFFQTLFFFFNWYRDEDEGQYCLVVFDYHLV